jgi:hypothetical protein
LDFKGATGLHVFSFFYFWSNTSCGKKVSIP